MKIQSSKKLARMAANTILDIFYPRKCIVCGVTVNIGRSVSVCSDCFKILGKLIKTVVEPDRYFDYAVCALPYDGNIKSAILSYKFAGIRHLHDSFGEVLACAVSQRSELLDYDMICPVPIHVMRQRDYNQSYLISRSVSEHLQIPVYKDLLLKLRHLSPLRGMGSVERKTGIVGAISFNYKYDIIGKNILLVDDIFTTGATTDECARILRMHGAQSVVVISACYADAKGEI